MPPLESLWIIEFSKTAEKQFQDLAPDIQKRIKNFLSHRLALYPDPRILGIKMVGNFSPFWRFRVGDYRIIADILEDRLIIEVIQMGHRKNIYQ